MRMLDGKVAIITGGAMGMGAATAELFASCGARVVVADLDEQLGDAVVRKIVADGGQAVFAKVDVSRSEQVSEMVKTAVRTFGRLDVAVNNAAISPDKKPLAEMDEDAFDAQLRVNLKSVALCLKYELGQMMAQGSKGSIVNIASVSGIRPQLSNPGYIAAKHGVIGLTKSASLDYSCHGIRVNAVAPGAVDTPMLRRQLQLVGRDLEATGKRLSQLGRTAQAVEIAHASLWLASDASSYITGVTLPADGGYTSM